jgi:hypothetical protein
MVKFLSLRTGLSGALLVLLLLFSLLGQAQPVKETNLPEGVMVSFRKSFPVIAADCFHTQDGDYQLSFRADGADRVYLYSEKGKLLVMRMAIEEHAIPGEIRESLLGMEGTSIVKAFKTKTPSSHYYEVLVKDHDRFSLFRYNSEKTRTAVTSLLVNDPLPRL